MTSWLLGSATPLQEAFDLALVDLDGVAYRGPEAIPTAPPALAAARAAGMELMFITNNANREPELVAEHLTDLGIPTELSEVLTAAQAVALMLAEQYPDRGPVLVVGGPGLRQAVSAQGFSIVASASDSPVAVVQGFAPDVAWHHLAEAAYAVADGAGYFASNLDRTLPNERGIAPGNGSLVQTVVNATGVTPQAAGKPQPTMFHLAADRAGAQRPLVIGDRLDTDLGGARAAGYPGLLVLTGVHDALDAARAKPEDRPSFIGYDLRTLAEVHPAPVFEGGWWTVGTAKATVRDGQLVIESANAAVAEAIDQIRAACVTSWAAADAGIDVAIDALEKVGVN